MISKTIFPNGVFSGGHSTLNISSYGTYDVPFSTTLWLHQTNECQERLVVFQFEAFKQAI